MTTPLRVLIVEDSDDDAQLLLRHLKRGHFTPRHERVQTAEEMTRALEQQRWDLVLADNSMPGFSAVAALEVLQKSQQDVPFIIVSGEIDDASAVGAMKAGAQDYLLKDNLARLVPAIERELADAKVRYARRRAEEELRYHAYHDPLTGLLNRREFEYSLQQALHQAKRDQNRHVLAHLDLDQLKLVNDTCGHAAGDQLLRSVARLLQRHVRAADTVARLGADEFALLLPRCHLQGAQRILEDMRHDAASRRFSYDGRSFELAFSIGVVEVTPESESATAVLSAADVACSTAKEAGRNRVHIYQPDDQELARRREEMRWVTRITEALDRDRLVLYQQPFTTLNDDPAQHREILVRLRDEHGELHLPGAFIPAAERFKLMPVIDRWVIRQVFRRLGAGDVPADSLADGAMFFINLSGATINDDGFLGFVREQLREHEVTPRRICFEITESVAIGNLRQSLEVFQALKQDGCRFALDDFGSGLSSFSYLKNLPVDFLKIDGGFVRDLADDPIDAAMVEAINNIGHLMGLRTVAEWVEQETVLERLRELRVDYAQGFALARPSPL